MYIAVAVQTVFAYRFRPVLAVRADELVAPSVLFVRAN